MTFRELWGDIKIGVYTGGVLLAQATLDVLIATQPAHPREAVITCQDVLYYASHANPQQIAAIQKNLSTAQLAAAKRCLEKPDALPAPRNPDRHLPVRRHVVAPRASTDNGTGAPPPMPRVRPAGVGDTEEQKPAPAVVTADKQPVTATVTCGNPRCAIAMERTGVPVAQPKGRSMIEHVIALFGLLAAAYLVIHNSAKIVVWFKNKRAAAKAVAADAAAIGSRLNDLEQEVLRHAAVLSTVKPSQSAPVAAPGPTGNTGPAPAA